MKIHKINKYQTSFGESNIFNTDFRKFFSNPEDTQILFYNLKNKLRYISLAKKVKNNTNNFKKFIQASSSEQKNNFRYYSSCTQPKNFPFISSLQSKAEVVGCNSQNFNYTNPCLATAPVGAALTNKQAVGVAIVETIGKENKKLSTLNIYPYGKQLQLSKSEISELNLKNSRSYLGLFGMFNTEIGKNSNIIYNFKKNYKFDNSIYLLYSILKHYFIAMKCIISKLYIIKTPYKFKISLFYYSKPIKTNLIIRELLRNIFNNTEGRNQRSENRSDEKIELYKKLYNNLKFKYKNKNYRQKKIIRFTPRLIPTSLPCVLPRCGSTGATAGINLFPSYPNLNFCSATLPSPLGLATQGATETAGATGIINLANTIKNKKKKLNSYFMRNRSRRAAYVNRLGNEFNYNKIFMNIINKLKLIFKLPIEFELVRLYYPFSNSNIFVNVISYISHKYNIYHICKKAFNLANVKNPTIIKKKNRFSVSRFNVFINPHGLTNHKLLFAFLSGINIKVAGRLLREPSIPRKTLKVFQIGTLARKKADIVEKARVTNKNKRGAFSITIYTGHAFL